MHQLIPAFILRRYALNDMSGVFPAVGMFVDVSGFSSMTDTLMQHGGHGAEVLAGVMRATFSPMIQAVFEQGGFVINQAGDSITALFPLERDENMATERALAAAWKIHRQAAVQPTFDTPYGQFTISVKVGLASGECQWGVLVSPDHQRAAYYFRGSVVDDCAEAEHQSAPGEIILDGKIAATAQAQVEVEPLGDYFWLRARKGELPQPIPIPATENNLEMARRFYPESMLTSRTSGEFRQIVSLFIHLPTVRTEAQLKIFIETFFQLQERYGGLLNRLSFGDKGSHLLIFWGAPVSYENDVERTLNFALELQAQTEVPISGGVTYRLAHAGFIGSELNEEYTGYGRGVNLAARFMTSAARGEIWLDADAARRAGKAFDLEPLGEKPFKGFAQPQEVYLLIEPKEQVEPVFQGQMVGRDNELEQLSRFIQPIFSRKYAGVLGVWGEPGLGKSRLVHEFLQELAGSHSGSFQVFLGQCDEILRQSLNPFRYWLKRYFEQSVEQSDARNRRNFNRKLDELIAATGDAALAEELDRTRSCLGALLGLEWPDSLYQQLDAQARFENTLRGLTVLLQAESCRLPVIFFLEDAHWLDDDSQAYLPRLLRELAEGKEPQYPIAVLLTARFEGTGLLLEVLPDQAIRLSELDRAGLENLAAVQLGGVISAALLDLLAERSEGNPFFTEQILRYLQEEGRLVQQQDCWEVIQNPQAGPIPVDVQALLVARLDRLSGTVREVVQTAAVLGREFEVRLLAEMLRDDPALPEKVNRAEQAAIWVALNEIHYLFRHALLRDAAYMMQLQARRQALHALALEALERLYPSTSGSSDSMETKPSPHYGELAYHAEQAGLGEQAVAYLIQAGDAARSAYQNANAVDFYTRALALAGPLTANDELRKLYLERGQALEQIGQYDQALANYQALTDLAKQRDDQTMELASLIGKGNILSIETSVQDRNRGVQVAQEALDLARDLHDRPAEAQALSVLAKAKLFLTQDAQQSLPYLEQAIAIAREYNLLDLLAQELIDSAGTYIFLLGQFEIGQARIAEANSIWQKLGKPYRVNAGLHHSAMAYLLSGQYAQAIQQLETAEQLDRTIGDVWGLSFCASLLGGIYLEQGEYTRAVGRMEHCIRYGEESGYLMGQIMGRATLGIIYGHLGRITEAIATCQEAIHLSKSKEDAFLAHALACLAWVQVFQGNLSQAEETIGAAWQALQRRVTYPVEPNYVAVIDGYVALEAQDWPRLQTSAERAIGMIEGMHNRFLALDASYLLARSLLAQGRVEAGRSLLLQTLSTIEAAGTHRLLWPVQFCLAQNEQDETQAWQWLSQAREALQTIANQIADAGQRAVFLNQSAARLALGDSL